jgi:hypothetical protein
MEFLHRYSDGSCLYRMSARALCRIPIWKGNRIIDEKHVQELKQSVGDKVHHLDSGYRLIRYEEEDEKGTAVKRSYVVDGQHRIRVLMDKLQESGPEYDFIVTVTELELGSEADVIQYFNQINHAKPILFTEDDKMIVNRYLKGVMDAFDSKWKWIRQGATRRPYLSADRFREHLVKHVHLLKRWSVSGFVEACKERNRQILLELTNQLEKTIREKTVIKDQNTMKKTIELEFGLAWDDKMRWIPLLLQMGVS